MNIAVLGAGAIGGWVAGRLSLAGEKVMALTSRGPLDHIQLNEGGRVQSASLCRFEGPAEVLVLAVKATALAAACRKAQPLVDDETIIVPMLNGVPWWFVEGMELKSIDPGGLAARVLPISQLIGCVVHASCSRSAGTVVVKHAEKMIIGKPGGDMTKELQTVETLFESAGLHPQVTSDVRRAIWYKLWGNATINPLSALTRVTCDKILADPQCRAWMLRGMVELAAIGAAVGCPISESGEDRMAVTARLGAFKTSMLQDVEAGRPMELDALLGAPREIARAHAIETPALDQLYAVAGLLADALRS